jgi:hypothetical protein
LAEQADRKNEYTPTPPMAEIMARYPTEDFTNMDIQENIKEQLKQCRENYKQAKENAKELRQAHLAERAEIAHLNGNITAEAAILQLNQIKAITNLYVCL